MNKRERIGQVRKAILIAAVCVGLILATHIVPKALATSYGIMYIQFGDSNCTGGFGSAMPTPDLENVWSGWFGDEDAYDADCARIALYNIPPQATDIVLGIQAEDFNVGCPWSCHTDIGNPQWTGGASGGGLAGAWTWSNWAGDGDYWDPDAWRIAAYTNGIGAMGGYYVSNMQLGLQFGDVPSNNGGCGPEYGITYSPPWSSGGGWSAWGADSNWQNFNCLSLGMWSQLSAIPPPPPPAPTQVPNNLASSCNAAGTQASLTFSYGGGDATYYYLRVRTPSDTPCPVGWTTSGNICYPNPDSVTTQPVVFPTTPGKTYQWYVHAANSGGYGPPSPDSAFTCNAPAPTCSLTLNPSTMTPPGGNVTGTWTSTNATVGEITPGDGVTGASWVNVGTSGSTAYPVSATTQYTFRATGSGGTCLAHATVTVGYASCVLDGVTVPHNGSYTFYNTTSVPYGQLCSSGAYSLLRTCNNGTLSPGSSFNHASCSVQAPPAQSAIVITGNNFATSTTVRKGSAVALAWNGGNSDICTVSGSDSSSFSGVTGSQSVVINQKTVFTLRCTLATQSQTKTMTVNLVPTIIEQ